VRNGADVVVTGRRKDVGEQFAAELAERSGRQVVYVRADAGDVGQVQAAVAETIQRFGRIDCVVNCAGLTTRGTVLDTTPELFDAHVAVNLRGPFFLIQAAIKDMVARGRAGPSSTSSRCRPTAASRTWRRTSRRSRAWSA
jgi:NAD(P)-dependent dehydrogenase (short-subunit alcohol dehydrogenase family)